MIVEVKVPQLSESVSEATLLDWHKKEGEPVKRDENLIDIETDKVVLELPAPADGVLVKIIKQAKDAVGSGDVIAQIDTEAKSSAPSAPTRGSAERAAPKRGAPVMPAAQKIAAEKGIDTSKIQGSGRDGRVTKGDVLEQAARPQPAAQPGQPGSKTGAAAAAAAHQCRGASLRPARAARADVAAAPARGRAPGAVAVDRRHPHDLQRGQHGAGDRDAQEVPGALREGARHAPRLHVVLRQGGGACAQALPGGQRLDRRHRHRLPRLLRHRRRGRQPARPGGADPARRRPHELRRDREEDRRLRQARAGRQARHRGAHRRHFLHLQRRRVRLDALDADHQPAAIGDPRRARHQGAAGGRERRRS